MVLGALICFSSFYAARCISWVYGESIQLHRGCPYLCQLNTFSACPRQIVHVARFTSSSSSLSLLFRFIDSFIIVDQK